MAHHPPNPQPPKLVARKSPECILSRMTHQMGPSPPQKRKPFPKPPPATKATPAPKTNPPKRGGRADDPLVGTKVHIPYSWGVDVGTVRDVHRRKAGGIWVEYPNNPQRYKVACNLLFPSPKAAHEHLERVRKPNTKATPPPSLRASLTRRLTP